MASAMAAAVFMLVVPPLAMLLVGSVTDTPPGVTPHFTLATLAHAWGESNIYPALLNSIVFAASVATLVLAGGSVLAWIVERTDARVTGMMNLLVVAPIIMPAVLLVNGWIMLLSPRSGMINLILTKLFGITKPPFDIFSFSGMLWITVLQELPFAFLWLWPSFRAMNPELEGNWPGR